MQKTGTGANASRKLARIPLEMRSIFVLTHSKKAVLKELLTSKDVATRLKPLTHAPENDLSMTCIAIHCSRLC